MLRTELIELINRGSMWAFVGSGLSARAGMPTWRALTETVVARLSQAERQRVVNDGRYEQAFQKKDYARALGAIERMVGRQVIDATVRELMSRDVAPDAAHHLLVDWPFAGMITTNYDHLLERAFSDARLSGWTAVGNTPSELPKVRGDQQKLVWHIHGSAVLPEDRSELVVTTQDYDGLYLEDSPAVRTLHALIAMRRLLFIGFGMRDEEVMRILRRVGRFASPATPIYAIISADAADDAERRHLRDEYNVEVVPYRVVDESHARLLDLLGVYDSFVVRRSLTFGQAAPQTPSYDAETTGLLLFNEFCLQPRTALPENVVVSLMKARIVAFLRFRGRATIEELVADFEQQAELLRTAGPTHDGAVSRALDVLTRDETVVVDGSDVVLTEKGGVLTTGAAAQAELLREQFTESVNLRCQFPDLQMSDEARRNVVGAAEAFLANCIEERALGVALSTSAAAQSTRQYHMVALFQALPRFMEVLHEPDEAVALVRLIQAIFANPTPEERRYIGSAIQARFAVHVLGYDVATLESRISELRNTLFIVDSATLIPFLARSSRGHEAAMTLLRRAIELGSSVATTSLLAYEVAEHASWALSAFDAATGRPNSTTFRAASGRLGRANAFQDGFLAEYREGRKTDLYSYLSDVTGSTITADHPQCRLDDLARHLEALGVAVVEFSAWDGFDLTLHGEKMARAERIGELRKQRNTYRHERQTEAEAEALIVVEQLRARAFGLRGTAVGNAFFMSPTRVIDDVSRESRAVTMRPEAALQWITTLSGSTPEELAVLTDTLLADMEVRDLQIIDPKMLEVTFSPLVNASRERLHEEREKHRALLSVRYGDQAFQNVASADTPVVLDSLLLQQVDNLGAALSRSENARRAAIESAAITQREKVELARFRAKAKQKGNKNRSRRSRKRK